MSSSKDSKRRSYSQEASINMPESRKSSSAALPSADRRQSVQSHESNNNNNNNNNNGGGGGSVVKRVAPALPPVPNNCWYATPFAEGSAQPLTEFHFRNKGRVLFAKRPIPTLAGELENLPNRSPPVSGTFEVGKDLIFGMAYLHNTALFTEHRWRTRVLHLKRVKEGTAEIPESILKAAQFTARAAEKSNSASAAAAAAPPTPTIAMDNSASSRPSSRRLSLSSERGVAGGQMQSIMSFARAEPSMFQHPFFDMLLGIKVFVNDVLVPDHYPGVASLPQCTATLDSNDALNNWICVPVILMGFLNHPTLDTIALYRTLSLSFVDHLLHLKGIPSPGGKPLELNVRVEVVYGCRAEAYFCTDFISRGSCTLVMTDSSKTAIKGYEEKLRALIKAKRSSEQVVRGPPPPPSALPGPVRNCPFCGCGFAFRCTVCGAELCGSAMCSQRPVNRYPRGCSAHKAQN